ncbi:MAG TPA: hypothetical protein VFX15_03375, partial [Actinomycetes bacterium]|nr:hypothetical protein [Actinomycetes bacterium]
GCPMTIDDRGRTATTELQDRALRDIDLDKALASVTAQPARTRPFAMPAIVLAVVAVTALLIWAQDYLKVDSAPPADSTPTQSPQPPDGRALDDAQAFILNTATGNRSPLSSHITKIPLAHNFVASPDGSQIAFSDFNHLYVTTLERGVVRTLSRADAYTVPAWSSDGEYLVYTVAGKCFVIELDTGTRQLVHRGGQPLFAPNFAPDNSAILITRRAGKAFGVWEVDLASGQKTLLRKRAAWGFYSPDGSTIAYRRTWASQPLDTEMTRWALSMMTASGEDTGWQAGVGNAGSQGHALAFWPSWSPSGAFIADQGWHTHGLRITDASNGDIVDVISTEDLVDSTSVWGSTLRSTWINDEHLIVEAVTTCSTTVEC